MRRCADSIDATQLPPGFDLYAGYVDGRWPSWGAICARFPEKPVISITVYATGRAFCLDVEQGDATPQQAPGWVSRMRGLGELEPMVYCSLAAWTEVRNAFYQQGVAEPQYWIAAYPGNGPALYPESVGHQWIDRGGYDESVMADFIPGLDTSPAREEIDDVTSYVNGTQEHVFWTNPATGVTTHRWFDHAAPDKGWNKEYLPA